MKEFPGLTMDERESVEARFIWASGYTHWATTRSGTHQRACYAGPFPAWCASWMPTWKVINTSGHMGHGGICQVLQVCPLWWVMDGACPVAAAQGDLPLQGRTLYAWASLWPQNIAINHTGLPLT